MKLRMGFVSNSSSSSFVIRLDNITEEQLNSLIKYHKSDKCKDEDGNWWITMSEGAGIVFGHNEDTYGSDLYAYMTQIGIDSNKVFSESI